MAKRFKNVGVLVVGWQKREGKARSSNIHVGREGFGRVVSGWLGWFVKG